MISSARCCNFTVRLRKPYLSLTVIEELKRTTLDPSLTITQNGAFQVCGTAVYFTTHFVMLLNKLAAKLLACIATIIFQHFLCLGYPIFCFTPDKHLHRMNISQLQVTLQMSQHLLFSSSSLYSLKL